MLSVGNRCQRSVIALRSCESTCPIAAEVNCCRDVGHALLFLLGRPAGFVCPLCLLEFAEASPDDCHPSLAQRSGAGSGTSAIH